MSASTPCRMMLSQPVPSRELVLQAEAELAAIGHKDSSLCRTTLSNQCHPMSWGWGHAAISWSSRQSLLPINPRHFLHQQVLLCCLALLALCFLSHSRHRMEGLHVLLVSILMLLVLDHSFALVCGPCAASSDTS